MNMANAPFSPPTDPEDGLERYVYRDRRIALAVNVSLVTRRPLLITGVPGSGKSTLARDVALHLGWAYVGLTVTSRTSIDDLLGSVDLVRRLSDAQVQGQLRNDIDYLIPGILWWAASPQTAGKHLSGWGRDPREFRENSEAGIVILLDEIDKAEPDLPNDLLGPLDGLRLTIPLIGDIEPQNDRWLVMVTSNGERAMPPAFLRRCISLELDEPDSTFLAAVARSHFGMRYDDLYLAVAEDFIAIRERGAAQGARKPSTAEFLDAIAVCIRLDERPGSPLWESVTEATLRKSRRRDANSNAVGWPDA